MVVGMDGGGWFVASHHLNVRLSDCPIVRSGTVSKQWAIAKQGWAIAKQWFWFVRSFGDWIPKHRLPLDTQTSFVRTSIVCSHERWLRSRRRIVSKEGYRDSIQSIETTLKWVVSMNNTTHHHTKFKTCPLPGPV